MQDLKVTLIQTELHWHDIEANLGSFEEKIWTLDIDTDIILLPEMFTTGFTMETQKFGEILNMRTFKWMKQIAAQTKALIIGSYIGREKDKFYNRLMCMRPDGVYHYYDKRHLFRMANEHHHYSAGNRSITVTWRGWNIRPLVCYDLRFPVWSRNRSVDGNMEYDLLLYVANWPAARIQAWDALLRARAVENLCYVAGLNRVGTDGNDIYYNGHSAVYDYKGKTVADLGEEHIISTIELSLDSLMAYRSKFPAHYDADNFEIRKRDP